MELTSSLQANITAGIYLIVLFTTSSVRDLVPLFSTRRSSQYLGITQVVLVPFYSVGRHSTLILNQQVTSEYLGFKQDILVPVYNLGLHGTLILHPAGHHSNWVSHRSSQYLSTMRVVLVPLFSTSRLSQYLDITQGVLVRCGSVIIPFIGSLTY